MHAFIDTCVHEHAVFITCRGGFLVCSRRLFLCRGLVDGLVLCCDCRIGVLLQTQTPRSQPQTPNPDNPQAPSPKPQTQTLDSSGFAVWDLGFRVSVLNLS